MATAVASRVRWGDVDDEEDALPPPSVSGPDARGVKTAVEYRRNERGEAVKVTTKTRVSKVERKVYTVSFFVGGARWERADRPAAAVARFFFVRAVAGAPPSPVSLFAAPRFNLPPTLSLTHPAALPYYPPSHQAAEERRHWARFGDAVSEAPTDSITVQGNEDIPFERVRAAKQTQDERKQAADMKSVLAGSDKSAIGKNEEKGDGGAAGRRDGEGRQKKRAGPHLDLINSLSPPPSTTQSAP